MEGDEVQLAAGLSADRARALKLKATLVVAVPAPQVQEEKGWQWFTDPPDMSDPTLTWVIDGSKKLGAASFTATTGCGVAVMDAEGNFVSAAWATPPPWVKTSYGAEVWALLLTLQSTAFPPRVITDCKSVLSTLKAGKAAAERGVEVDCVGP